MYNFDSLFHRFETLKVAIVGDVMLDTYWFGNVDRISPEAPVPVVALKKKEYRIGGAGNVALNAVALGAQTSLFSVIGDDEDGTLLNSLFNNAHINTTYLVKSEDRITTNKIRIICRNQQMMRLDAEITKEITEEDERILLQNFSDFVLNNKPDVVVLEDYNKGVLTPTLINQVIDLCNSHNIITTVDPKRKNFFAYKGVSIFKPNLSEVKEALQLLPEDVSLSFLNEVHSQLAARLQHKISLITLSENGVFYKDDNEGKIIPTHVRDISDVSGAGDTVIAVASLVYAATNNMQLAAEVANIAGGLVCEEVGTVAINKQKLLNECRLLIS